MRRRRLIWSACQQLGAFGRFESANFTPSAHGHSYFILFNISPVYLSLRTYCVRMYSTGKCVYMVICVYFIAMCDLCSMSFANPDKWCSHRWYIICTIAPCRLRAHLIDCGCAPGPSATFTARRSSILMHTRAPTVGSYSLKRLQWARFWVIERVSWYF